MFNDLEYCQFVSFPFYKHVNGISALPVATTSINDNRHDKRSRAYLTKIKMVGIKFSNFEIF